MVIWQKKIWPTYAGHRPDMHVALVHMPVICLVYDKHTLMLRGIATCIMHVCSMQVHSHLRTVVHSTTICCPWGGTLPELFRKVMKYEIFAPETSMTGICKPVIWWSYDSSWNLIWVPFSIAHGVFMRKYVHLYARIVVYFNMHWDIAGTNPPLI